MTDPTSDPMAIIDEFREIGRGVLSALAESNQLIRSQQKTMDAQHEIIKSIKWELNLSRRIQENLRVTLSAPVLDQMQEFLHERQLGLLESLRYVRENRVSMARFGDGEFRLMNRLDFNLQFQRNSPDLQRALRETLEHGAKNPKDLIIGLPHGYRDVFWGGIYGDVWRQVLPLLEPISSFVNSHITRPHIFGVHGSDAVTAWSDVWREKKVTVITGKDSRFDLVPELFGSASSIDFLQTKPANAFEVIPKILQEAEARESDLFLISLGPAGTVLVPELARRGMWALDVGHLSSSYNFEFENAPFPENTKA